MTARLPVRGRSVSLAHVSRVVVLESGRRLEGWRSEIRKLGFTTVSSVEQLEETLRSGLVDVVVCGWDPTLFERIQDLRRGTRIICCDPGLPSELLDAVGEGYRIQHASTLEELKNKAALALRAPRAAARQELAETRLTFGGAAESFEIVDMSSDGLAFATTAAQPIDDMFPGAELTDVRLERRGDIALEGVTAVVKSIVPHDLGGYRIGCELKRPGAAPARSLVVRERVLCAGLVRSALREDGITLTTGSASVAVRSVDADVDLENGTITVPCDVELGDLDIVRATFERDSYVYRFTTAVLASSPLVLKLPDSLVQLQQRAAERFRPTDGDDAFVELESPLWDDVVRRPVRDLSVDGLSFDVLPQATEPMVPVGLRLTSITLHVGDEVFRCEGQIRSQVRIEGSEAVRCGVAFSGLDAASQVALTNYITSRRFPTLADGGTLPVHETLGFFREGGFLPPEKERVVGPLRAGIEHTYTALSAPNPLFKSFIVKNDERVVGYVSGVATYSKTFQFQHLVGLRGRRAGGVLVRAIIEHLLHRTDYEYAMFWFLRGNPFPSRVFGGFGFKVLDPNLCDMRQYAHVTLDVTRQLAKPDDAFEVSDATELELAVIERQCIAKLGSLLVRAHDLTRKTLRLDRIGDAYDRLGLLRRRRVLVARLCGQMVGFALAEVSSPGLNLSEGLSSFRLHVLPEAERLGDQVRLALATALQQTYAEADRGVALGLVDPADSASFSRIGLAPDAVSYGCTAHRSQLRLFAEHTTRVTVPRRGETA